MPAEQKSNQEKPTAFSTWKPIPLFNAYFGAALLSMLLWRNQDIAAINEWAFFLLNGSLEKSGNLWVGYWAITNSRYFDTASGIFLGLVCLSFLFLNRDWRFAERLSRVILVVIGVAATMIAISKGLSHIEHPSPSRLLTPFVNINDLVDWISVKTGSSSSFPSDHAAVSFISAWTMWRLFGRRYGLLVSVFAVINATPRLVGGGHWLSDVVMGGTALTLAIGALLLYIPLLGIIRGLVVRLCALPPLQNLLQRFD